MERGHSNVCISIKCVKFKLCRFFSSFMFFILFWFIFYGFIFWFFVKNSKFFIFWPIFWFFEKCKYVKKRGQNMPFCVKNRSFLRFWRFQKVVNTRSGKSNGSVDPVWRQIGLFTAFYEGIIGLRRVKMTKSRQK